MNLEFKKEWSFYFQAKKNLPALAKIFKPGTLPAYYKVLSRIKKENCLELLYEDISECIDELNNENFVPGSSTKVWEAVKIITNELSEHHTIISLGNRLFVHPVYFARLFKKNTGFSVGEYQQRIKLKAAFNLLTNTNLPVFRIANQTGFHDSSHLINLFKKYYGFSPRQLRLDCKS
jgi:AraC family transcriptional regulator